MPKPFPKEFRDDVVAIALKRESSFAQIAKDFGISESCVQRWVKIAEVDGARRPGISSSEAAENRELRKRVKLNRPDFRSYREPCPAETGWADSRSA